MLNRRISNRRISKAKEDDAEFACSVFYGLCDLPPKKWTPLNVKKEGEKGVFMPRYSKEFKEQAVERLRSTGESVHRVSEELGVSWAALTRWCRQLEAEGTVGSGNTEEELQAARKTIRRLEMEREILKKAAAFFAKESE